MLRDKLGLLETELLRVPLWWRITYNPNHWGHVSCSHKANASADPPPPPPPHNTHARTHACTHLIDFFNAQNHSFSIKFYHEKQIQMAIKLAKLQNCQAQSTGRSRIMDWDNKAWPRIDLNRMRKSNTRKLEALGHKTSGKLSCLDPSVTWCNRWPIKTVHNTHSVHLTKHQSKQCTIHVLYTWPSQRQSTNQNSAHVLYTWPSTNENSAQYMFCTPDQVKDKAPIKTVCNRCSVHLTKSKTKHQSKQCTIDVLYTWPGQRQSTNRNSAQ